MSINYYDDPVLLGYWFDEDNGISQHYGFFHLLDNLKSSDYTTTEGNPIETWLQPVEGSATEYNGIAYAELDGLYIARSGSKIVRPFYVSRWINKPLSARTQAVLRITRMYSKKWRDLWETMFYDFDPIENYNMSERLTNDVKAFQHGHDETTTLQNMQHTKTGTETETPAVTTTTTDKIYGFDSNNAVNANQTIISPSGTNQMLYNLTEGDSGSTKTENRGTDTETRNYLLTRSGNIGVTTSQQMIEQQRKLVMYNYFDTVVFPDIDKAITLQVY